MPPSETLNKANRLDAPSIVRVDGQLRVVVLMPIFA